MSGNGVGPAGPVRISVTHVNVTKGHRYGEDAQEVDGCSISWVFASLKREYGGHVSRVHRDTKDGPQHVGWTFRRRVEYEDAVRGERKYLRETWVTFFRDAMCGCCGTVSGRWSVTVEEVRKLLRAVA